MEQHHYTEHIHNDQTGEMIGVLRLTHIETTPTDPLHFRFGDADLTDFSNMTMEVRKHDSKKR